MTPSILTLALGEIEWSISCWLLYPQEKSPRFPMDRRLG